MVPGEAEALLRGDLERMPCVLTGDLFAWIWALFR